MWPACFRTLVTCITPNSNLYCTEETTTPNWNRHSDCVVTCRVAGSEVKYPTQTFPKFPTPPFRNFRLLNIKGMKFGCWNQWKSWCTARNLCFNKIFKRSCTLSTGIPNWSVWFKKWSNWTPGIGVEQKYPTLAPPKNIWLLTTPQPWLLSLSGTDHQCNDVHDINPYNCWNILWQKLYEINGKTCSERNN